MNIDYKLAARAINRAITQGTDSLVGNYRQPALAFVSNGPDPNLYRPRQDSQQPLDARVTAYYRTPDPPTNVPTARETLQRLLYL